MCTHVHIWQSRLVYPGKPDQVVMEATDYKARVTTTSISETIPLITGSQYRLYQAQLASYTGHMGESGQVSNVCESTITGTRIYPPIVFLNNSLGHNCPIHLSHKCPKQFSHDEHWCASWCWCSPTRHTPSTVFNCIHPYLNKSTVTQNCCHLALSGYWSSITLTVNLWRQCIRLP